MVIIKLKRMRYIRVGILFNMYQKTYGEWANDTTIGAETREDLIKLSNALGSLIEETRRLQSKLLVFCDEQDRINGQNTNWKNGKSYVTTSGREVLSLMVIRIIKLKKRKVELL